MNKAQKIKKQIKALKEELNKINKSFYWSCPHCKKRTMIGSLILYVPTHTDYGSYDYSQSVDDFPQYRIHCPKCKYLVRYVAETKYDPYPNNILVDCKNNKQYKFIHEHAYDGFKNTVNFESKCGYSYGFEDLNVVKSISYFDGRVVNI